jgi:DNA-binding PadR family transcriptional regulator
MVLKFSTEWPLYKALDRLEKSGFVASRMGQPSAERGGRAKRFVHVTEKGLRAIDQASRGNFLRATRKAQ